MKSFLIIGFCLCNLISYCYTARILGIFPSCGYSQFILGGKLMRELASRGHEVTVISPFPSKTTINNYKDVAVKGLLELCKEANLFDLEPHSSMMNILDVNELGSSLTEYTLKADPVKQLLNSNATFDLVICELFFNYAHMAFAHHFKVPLVLFSSQGPNEWSKSLLRHPLPFVYVPFGSGGYNSEMSTVSRIKNLFDYLFFDIFNAFFIIPHHNKLLKEHLPKSPYISDIIPTIELLMFNSHVSSNLAVPLLPNMIEVGGLHIDPKPLPEDLQKFLDEAVDGAIYFSMGSNLKSRNLPIEKRNALFRVFSNLKLKILWKFEDETIEMPKNVKIGKWLPQQDILAHPNIKLFITHSGLLSTIEAVYFGVPMLSIPIYGDQRVNAALSKERGIGLTLNFQNITVNSLAENINELLTNSIYSANAKFRSTLMRDQETKPMDRAIFWVEYVSRHKGARHLQVHGAKMPWYEYYTVDLIIIILSSIIVLLFICQFIKNKCKTILNNDKRKIKTH